MASKLRQSSQKPQDKSLLKRAENTWILLTKSNLINANEPLSVISIPHPGSGLPARYCLDQINKKVYEVAVFDEPHRSWFIGESVKSDGKLHITTLVNPTFLVLPKLISECSTRAIPLEDLLADEGFNKIMDFIPSLDHVADIKGPPDMKAYKYNEKKTLIWLESRVRIVARTLRSKNMHVTSGAVSATFVTSSRDHSNVDEEFYLKYAHGLVSEYLTESLSETLQKHFDFKPELIETLAKKRKSDADENKAKKKVMKTEPVEEHKENCLINTNPKSVKPATLSNKEKARQKAANNSKSISSFFVKK